MHIYAAMLKASKLYDDAEMPMAAGSTSLKKERNLHGK